MSAPDEEKESALETEAAARRRGMLREIGGYLWTNRNWWLLPFIVVLILLGLFVALGATVAAPFIYTLF